MIENNTMDENNTTSAVVVVEETKQEQEKQNETENKRKSFVKGYVESLNKTSSSLIKIGRGNNGNSNNYDNESSSPITRNIINKLSDSGISNNNSNSNSKNPTPNIGNSPINLRNVKNLNSSSELNKSNNSSNTPIVPILSKGVSNNLKSIFNSLNSNINKSSDNLTENINNNSNNSNNNSNNNSKINTPINQSPRSTIINNINTNRTNSNNNFTKSTTTTPTNQSPRNFIINKFNKETEQQQISPVTPITPIVEKIKEKIQLWATLKLNCKNSKYKDMELNQIETTFGRGPSVDYSFNDDRIVSINQFKITLFKTVLPYGITSSSSSISNSPKPTEETATTLSESSEISTDSSGVCSTTSSVTSGSSSSSFNKCMEFLIVYIEDCGSVNGTYVNGIKLVKGEKVQLEDKSKITLSTPDLNLTHLSFTFESAINSLSSDEKSKLLKSIILLKESTESDTNTTTSSSSVTSNTNTPINITPTNGFSAAKKVISRTPSFKMQSLSKPDGFILILKNDATISNLRLLSTTIKSNDDNWKELFIATDSISLIIDLISSNNKKTKMNENDLLIDIECIDILNSIVMKPTTLTSSIKQISKCHEPSFNDIMLILLNSLHSNTIKIQLFQFYTAILPNEQCHKMILSSIEKVQFIKRDKIKFKWLFESIVFESELDYKLNCMIFINSILVNCKNSTVLAKVKSDLEILGIGKINDLLLLESNIKEMSAQITKFNNNFIISSSIQNMKTLNLKDPISLVLLLQSEFKQLSQSTPTSPTAQTLNIVNKDGFSAQKNPLTSILTDLYKITNSNNLNNNKSSKMDSATALSLLSDLSKSISNSLSNDAEYQKSLPQLEEKIKKIIPTLNNTTNTTTTTSQPPTPPQPSFTATEECKNEGTTSAPPPPPPPPGTSSNYSTESPTIVSAPPPPPPPPMKEGKSANVEEPLASGSGSAPPPPPPPPMKGGKSTNGGPPPPPPPPTGGKSTQPKIKEESPSVPMKQLFWTKIPNSKIKKTIWEKPEKFDLDKTKIESLFCTKKPVDKNSNSDKKGKEAEKISLLDPRRTYTIGILLTKFKLTPIWVIDCLTSMDEKKLSKDMVCVLMKIVPSIEEEECFKKYEGDKSQLSMIDQFLIETLKVPKIRQRLECILYKVQFESLVEEVVMGAKSIESCCSSILKSTSFKGFLHLILKIGNFMNAGSNRGNAEGFKFAFLLTVANTKSIDNKTTLLNYILQYVSEKYPDLLISKNTISQLENASRVMWGELLGQFELLKSGMSMVQKELELQIKQIGSDYFTKKFKKFTHSKSPHLDSLQIFIKQVEESYANVITFFGEDSMQPEEFFSTINNFVLQVIKAHKENEDIRIASLPKSKKYSDGKSSLDNGKSSKDVSSSSSTTAATIEEVSNIDNLIRGSKKETSGLDSPKLGFLGKLKKKKSTINTLDPLSSPPQVGNAGLKGKKGISFESPKFKSPVFRSPKFKVSSISPKLKATLNTISKSFEKKEKLSRFDSPFTSTPISEKASNYETKNVNTTNTAEQSLSNNLKNRISNLNIGQSSSSSSFTSSLPSSELNKELNEIKANSPVDKFKSIYDGNNSKENDNLQLKGKRFGHLKSKSISNAKQPVPLLPTGNKHSRSSSYSPNSKVNSQLLSNPFIMLEQQKPKENNPTNSSPVEDKSKIPTIDDNSPMVIENADKVDDKPIIVSAPVKVVPVTPITITELSGNSTTTNESSPSNFRDVKLKPTGTEKERKEQLDKQRQFKTINGKYSTTRGKFKNSGSSFHRNKSLNTIITNANSEDTGNLNFNINGNIKINSIKHKLLLKQTHIRSTKTDSSRIKRGVKNVSQKVKLVEDASPPNTTAQMSAIRRHNSNQLIKKNNTLNRKQDDNTPIIEIKKQPIQPIQTQPVQPAKPIQPKLSITTKKSSPISSPKVISNSEVIKSTPSTFESEQTFNIPVLKPTLQPHILSTSPVSAPSSASSLEPNLFKKRHQYQAVTPPLSSESNFVSSTLAKSKKEGNIAFSDIDKPSQQGNRDGYTSPPRESAFANLFKKHKKSHSKSKSNDFTNIGSNDDQSGSGSNSNSSTKHKKPKAVSKIIDFSKKLFSHKKSKSTNHSSSSSPIPNKIDNGKSSEQASSIDDEHLLEQYCENGDVAPSSSSSSQKSSPFGIQNTTTPISTTSSPISLKEYSISNLNSMNSSPTTSITSKPSPGASSVSSASTSSSLQTPYFFDQNKILTPKQLGISKSDIPMVISIPPVFYKQYQQQQRV